MQNNKTDNSLWWFLGIVIVVILLFIWASTSGSDSSSSSSSSSDSELQTELDEANECLEESEDYISSLQNTISDSGGYYDGTYEELNDAVGNLDYSSSPSCIDYAPFSSSSSSSSDSELQTELDEANECLEESEDYISSLQNTISDSGGYYDGTYEELNDAVGNLDYSSSPSCL